MAHPRCLAHPSPARALHRILVSDLPVMTPSLGRQTASYLLPPRLFSSYSHVLPARQTLALTTPQIRSLSTTPALQRIVQVKKRLTNDNIPFQWVRLVQEDGLSAAQPTARVLGSINTKTHTLVMVAPPPPPEDPSCPSSSSFDPDFDPPPPAAICRILDNAALAEAEAEMAAAARRKSVDVKEVEMSWSISAHDLSHKTKRIREFLGKGLTVEIALAKKRRGREATREEAQKVITTIREAIAQVDDVKETRKVEGTIGGFMKMYFTGPVEKRKKRKKQVEEEDVEVEAEPDWR
ncbi:hypothetical protein F4806DRAFT_461111 [Annulohypoxylon nitens]|nr:hypothetical protein F4806DRAFT_461111 [Annulohypoxylon nitens]